jgi:hypothetical protein
MCRKRPAGTEDESGRVAREDGLRRVAVVD